MASINIASIESKILAYANSDKGKKKREKKLIQYVEHNVDTTDAGSFVVNKRRMKEAATALVKFVKQAASSGDVAASVLADISTLKASNPKRVGGTTWEVTLSFGSDLGRASLQPERYGGVYNIIAIFNNGYPKDAGRIEAISHVYGEWGDIYVFARPYREALSFMQHAVAEFNAMYAASYNVYVELNGIYEG